MTGKPCQRWEVELAECSASTLPSAAAAVMPAKPSSRGVVLFSGSTGVFEQWVKGTVTLWHTLRKSQVNGWWKEVTPQPLKTGLPQHYLLCPNFFFSTQYHAHFSCTFSLIKSTVQLSCTPSHCLTPPTSLHQCQQRGRSCRSLPAGLAARLCQGRCCLSPLPWANKEMWPQQENAAELSSTVCQGVPQGCSTGSLMSRMKIQT